MTTNNALNKASEVFVVGPIGTAADGGTLLTVRKDQSATTAIGILNETNNASSQSFLNIKQQLNAGGSPYLSNGGVGIVNDQAASNVYAGYFVLQNEIGGTNTGALGLVLWDAHATGTVKVGVGAPATAVDQAVWTTTGGQYRGKNTNTAAPAGYIGEVLSASNTSGTSLSSNTWTNVTSKQFTPGNWLLYGRVAFETTGTISAGNITWDWDLSASSASGTPISGGIYNTDYNNITGTGVSPINGIGGLGGLVGPYPVSISANTTYYLNGRGSTSGASFTNVTVKGTIFGVRVG